MTKKNRIKKKHRKITNRYILKKYYLSVNKQIKLSGKQFPRTRHRNLRKSQIKILRTVRYKLNRLIKNNIYGGSQRKYYDLFNNNIQSIPISILRK